MTVQVINLPEYFSFLPIKTVTGQSAISYSGCLLLLLGLPPVLTL